MTFKSKHVGALKYYPDDVRARIDMLELWCWLDVPTRLVLQHLGGMRGATELLANEDSEDIGAGLTEAATCCLLEFDAQMQPQLTDRGRALLDWWRSHKRIRGVHAPAGKANDR